MFWKQYKEYIIISTVFALGVALVWFGILPLHNKIQAFMDTTQSLLVERDMTEASIVELDRVRSDKNLIHEHGNRLNVVINKSDIVVLIKDIESIAEETDNTIQIDAKELPPVAKNKPKPDDVPSDKNDAKKVEEEKAKKEKEAKPVEKKLLESLPSDKKVLISIKVTGTYENILHFLKKIETMPYVTDVMSLAIKPQEKLVTLDVAQGDIFTFPPATSNKNEPKKSSVKNKNNLPLVATFETVVYVNE